MSASVTASPPEANAAARALKGAAGFWFLAALVGQWTFLYYLVSFYGVSTVTGNFPAWTTALGRSRITGSRSGGIRRTGTRSKR
jgi:hypothetical protein